MSPVHEVAAGLQSDPTQCRIAQGAPANRPVSIRVWDTAKSNIGASGPVRSVVNDHRQAGAIIPTELSVSAKFGRVRPGAAYRVAVERPVENANHIRRPAADAEVVIVVAR